MTDPTLLQAFKENPLFFFLAFVVGAIAFVLGIVAVAAAARSKSAARPIAIVAVLLGAATVGVGGLGAALERSRAQMVVGDPGLGAGDKERIHAYAEESGEDCLVFGAAASAPGALLAVVALVMSTKRKG
jgi:hypothetical protein